MRNDYYTQSLRETLVNLKRNSNYTPAWFNGFVASFVYDYTEIKDAIRLGCVKKTHWHTTEQDVINEYTAGFEAGLQLRKAVEIGQAESSNVVVLDDPLS